MVAHAAVGVAIAVTAMSSSNSVSLVGFENCRVRLWNARVIADTAKRTNAGYVDPRKWGENQKGFVGTLSLVPCPSPRSLSSSVAQSDGSPLALLKEQEVVINNACEPKLYFRSS